MKRKSHIEGFLEHTEKLNISDVSDSEYSFNIIKGEENIFEFYLQDELIGQSKFSNPEKSSYFGENSIEIFDLKVYDEFAYNLYKSFGFETYFSNYGYLSMFKKIIQ